MVANRTTLNKEQKIALITYKNTNPSTSNVDLSKWIKQSYNLVVHPSTIGRILKRKIDDIVGNDSELYRFGSIILFSLGLLPSPFLHISINSKNSWKQNQ